MEFNINISGLLYLLNSIVDFFFVLRLHRAAKKTPTTLIHYFEKMAFLSGIGMLIMVFFFTFFASNPFILGIGINLAEPFYLMTFIYGIVLFFAIVKPSVPSWQILVPGAALVTIGIFLNFTFFSYPWIDERGIVHFNTVFLSGMVYNILSTFGILPLAGAFIFEGIRNKKIRARSIQLALSLIAIFSAGITASYATSEATYITALLLFSAGFAALFSAVIIGVESEKSIL